MARILHNNTAIYMTLASGALIGALFLHFTSHRMHQSTVRMAGVTIPVTVADTEALRTQGLSGTPSLKQGTGMLFLFDHPGTYGFWMKDMQYPLDIVWIDGASRVIGVSADIPPATYPEVFYPALSVSSVLEMNGGDALKDGLSVGSRVQFDR